MCVFENKERKYNRMWPKKQVVIDVDVNEIKKKKKKEKIKSETVRYMHKV